MLNSSRRNRSRRSNHRVFSSRRSPWRRSWVESLEDRYALTGTIVELNPAAFTGSTGEKPQSKVWEHGGQWWSIFSDATGIRLWRLDGVNWVYGSQNPIGSGTKQADVKTVGSVIHVLLESTTASQLVSLEYDSGSNRYVPWSTRSTATNVSLNGAETATMDIDSTGRMWVAWNNAGSTLVRYSDAPYNTFSSPITLNTGASGDDISMVVAFNNQIGVFWSDQNDERFGFRVHQDGASPTTWSADEVPASQSAKSVGSGMADDHMNAAVGSDGTLFFSVKTSYDTPGETAIAMVVRRPNGVWDNLYEIDPNGTRPTIVLDTAHSLLLIAYRDTNTDGPIVVRECTTTVIVCSAEANLISGASMNNVSSTKDPVSGEAVFISGGSGTLGSARWNFGGQANTAPNVSAGSNQNITTNSTTLNGSVSDDGLPVSPGHVTTTWSLQSGPAAPTIQTPSSLNTSVTLPAFGTYVFRLSAFDGELTSFSDVEVQYTNSAAPIDISFQNGVAPTSAYAGNVDTKTRSDFPTTNYGAATTLEADGNPDFSSLLLWDISAIPSNATVLSADITVNVVNSSTASFEIYQMLRAWDEATATYEQASTGTPWGSPGAAGILDRANTVLGVATSPSTGSASFPLNAAGLAVLQQWITNPSSNHGFIFQDYDNLSTDDLDVSTSEVSTLAQRPRLNIRYSLSSATPGVTISPSGGSTTVAEGGASDTYTLVLNSAPSANVTVQVTPDSQATVGATSYLFTPANWNVPQTVTVTAVDDAIAEGSHVSLLAHSVSSSDPNYSNFSLPSLSATIQDNDVASVVVTPSGGSTNVAEGGATDDYTVVLTSAPTANVIIQITPDSQTTSSASTLTFTSANWNVPQSVTVTAVDDAVAEGSHSSVITHSASSTDTNYNGLTVASVSVNVQDNDTAGVTIMPSGGSTNVTEGGATDDYSVVLNAAPTHDVTVSIVPDSQTNTSASLLTFTSANWNVPQTVTVTAVDDAVVEGSHSSVITHSASSTDTNYNGITVASVSVNVQDNDTAGVTITPTGGSTNVTEGGATDDYSVVLNTAPTADVTVTITHDTQSSTSVPTLTFTTANWNVPQSVTVTAVDDAVAEGSHSSVITHSVSSTDANYNGITVASVNVNVQDNDTAGVTITPSGGSTDVTEGGATDDYTVVLTSAPTADVTIQITPDSQSSVSPTSLLFTAANWNVPQTVTVTASDDSVIEGTHSSVITHSITSADTHYSALTLPSLNVTITDNDFPVPGITISLTGASTDVAEGGATDDYSVVLNAAPTHDVTITIVPDSQTNTSASLLTFTSANWNVPQTVTVTAVDDAVVEGSHSSVITHSASSTDTNYNGITVASVSVNVQDNDTAGVTITPSGGSTNVTEGGATDDYSVVLNAAPTHDVTVTITPDTQSSTSVLTLTFTTANWNVPQSVTVTAVDDAVAEGSHSSVITHSVSSTDTNYNGLTVASVNVNVQDNDTAGVTITPSGGSTNVAEGGATDDYTVVLTSAPTADVTIQITPDSQSSVSPTSLLFTAANWNVPQTVTVTASDDSVIEGTHSSVITHGITSADTHYSALTLPSLNVTITDNDFLLPGVTIAPSGGSTNVGEGGATDSYTIVLDSDPTADVTIQITPDGQSTVSATILTFTPANWNVPQTVTVTAVDDSAIEGTHSSAIAHSVTSLDPNYSGLSLPSLSATITDNDFAGVTLVQSGGTTALVEGGASDSYTLVLNAAPSSNVTITVSPDSQSTVSPTSLVFTPANWNVPQTVTVTAAVDAVTEGNHSSVITHTSSSADVAYQGLAIASVTASITEPTVTVAFQDGLSPTVAYAGTRDARIRFSNQTVNFGNNATIEADGSPDVSTLISWDLSSVPSSSTVVSATITLNVTDTSPSAFELYQVLKPWQESTTTFLLADTSLPWQTAGAAGATDRANTILGAVTGSSLGAVTFALNSAGIAQLQQWVTSPSTNYGFVIQDYDNSASDNVTFSSSEVATKSLRPKLELTYSSVAPAGVTVTPSGGSTNVTEGGASDTYSVVLNRAPSADVTIQVNSGSQTNASPTTLVFTPATWNVPQTVTVSAVDDAVIEGTHSATVSHTISSLDASYASVSVPSVSVTITDNDLPPAGVTLVESGGTTTVTEGGANDTYTLVLTRAPSSDVTISVNSGSQTSVSSTSLIFTAANWNVPQTVTVSAVDDAVVEGTHSATISHTISSLDSSYASVSVPSVNVTIADNDLPPAGVTIVESGGSTNLVEGGAADTYTFVLTTAPTANVTVNVSPDAQTTVAPTALTFTTANWNVPQTVSVTAIADATVEGNHLGFISHTLTSADARYQGLSVAQVVAAITEPASSTTVTFQDGVSPTTAYSGTRDSRIRFDQPAQNFGTSPMLEVDGNPDFSSLLQWDVSTIPAGSVVTAASITIDVINTSTAVFELYELLKPWQETSVNWTQAATGVPWSVAGASGSADRASAVVAGATSNSLGLVTLPLTAAGLSVVEKWISNPATNFGFIMQDYDNASTDDLDFRSSEYGTLTSRPKLSVTYQPPSSLRTFAVPASEATETLTRSENSDQSVEGPSCRAVDALFAALNDDP